jgi:signal transduction histidine kinase
MRSVRRTLVRTILGGVGAVLLISGITVYAIARVEMRERFDEEMVAKARTFAAMVVEEPPTASEPSKLVFEYFGSLGAADLGAFVRVSTGDGKELAKSPEWQGEWTRSPALGDEAVQPDLHIGRASARGAAVAALATRDPEDVHPEPAERTPTRTAIVQVVALFDEVEETESALAWALVIGGLTAMGGAAAAVWVGVRRGLAPLARLQDELAGLDPSALATVSGAAQYPEELRPVVSTLQELLVRLGAAMERERRFTDAAAHELRTPIAELRTIVDVARRWPDEERMRRSFAEADGVAEEMEGLLEVLLAAARGGAVHAGQEQEEVSLLPLAREIASRTPTSGVSWAFEGDETGWWRGAPTAVAAIVRNVVQNAGEHTSEGGSVQVSVVDGDGGAILRVANGPVTLSAADVERMFEPFWRKDASRTDRTHRGLSPSGESGLI